MQENTKFPKAMCDYIINTDKREISGDAFYLLSDIYSSSSFKDLCHGPFIKALFDSLSIITDEKNFNSIVKILTNINYEESIEDEKKLSENEFLKVFTDHDNSRILIESLIRILNYEDKDKEVMYRVLQCLKDIIDSTNDSVMYSSDLESFINTSIIKLESTYTDELRQYTLEVILRVTKYDEYYKTRYKIDELTEIIESYIDHESVDEDSKKLCKKILENLNSH
jgi:hypothetical protein